jgi:HD superfamily phosphodiesterase
LYFCVFAKGGALNLKQALLQAMEFYFGRDIKRINHARKVLGHAEKILEKEQGDRQVVEAAAVLHDIGIHAAERKYGSTAGHLQEIEGPPIAENILRKIDFPEAKISEVLEIIAYHHTPGKIDTVNFKIIYRADGLVNSEAEKNAAY